MNPFSDKEIKTLGDWNDILGNGCCCTMPSCPSPTKECQSVGGSVDSAGYYDPAATTWGRSTTESQTWNLSHDESTNSFMSGLGTYVSKTESGSGSATETNTYDRLFQGGISGTGCQTWTAKSTFSCSAAGSGETNTYQGVVWSTGGTNSNPTVSYSYAVKDVSTFTANITNAAGQPNPEREAFDLEHPDFDPAEEQTRFDNATAAYDAAIDQYNIDYQQWLDGGEVGDEPVFNMEPPELLVQPEAAYADCTYKITTEDREYNKTYLGDTIWDFEASAAGIIPEGVYVGDLRTSAYIDDAEDTVVDGESIVAGARSALNAVAGFIGGTITSTGKTWSGTQNYATWVGSAKGTLLAALSFGSSSCLGSSCTSKTDVGAEPSDVHGNVNIYLSKSRFRWVVPNTFKGSYFKVTWDVLEVPTTGARSFHKKDQTWEWTGPGDAGNPDSWKSAWFVIEPPSVNGERSVENVRFECYRSPFGSKPQSVGTPVVL